MVQLKDESAIVAGGRRIGNPPIARFCVARVRGSYGSLQSFSVGEDCRRGKISKWDEKQPVHLPSLTCLQGGWWKRNVIIS
jgi:hypothetical protein